jgi:hypothetical protein
LTAQDNESKETGAAARIHGRSADGYAVVSVRGAGHSILLVSDIDAENLVQLSEAVSVPLIRQLDRTVSFSDHQPLAVCVHPGAENLILPGL